MPSTLKSIIATIFYLCTVATTVQIPSERFQQLDRDFHNLRDNIAHHETHVTGPFTEALLNQMLAVKFQVSDIVADLGCAEQKPKEDVCYVLELEQLRLEFDILTKGMEWYIDAEKKEMKRWV